MRILDPREVLFCWCALDEGALSPPQFEELLRRIREGATDTTVGALLTRHGLVREVDVRRILSRLGLAVLPGPTPEGPGMAPVPFGRYALLGKIGAGSMATLFRARDTTTGHILALKVLQTAGQDDVFIQRFFNEARAVSKLKHPNIVVVHDCGTSGDNPYIAMDFVEGVTFADLISKRQVFRARGLRILATVARAADHAHAAGIVHRDIKPANILIDVRGAPFLTDFGLALDARTPSPLTRRGMTVGTPAYMSPEQARGQREAVDARSDVYSLGAVLYEFLTGRVVFQGGTALDLMDAAVRQEPSSPREGDSTVPKELAAICLRTLEKDRSRRFQTAAELADALDRFLTGRKATPGRPAPGRGLVSRKKVRILLIALAALAGLVALWVAFR